MLPCFCSERVLDRCRYVVARICSQVTLPGGVATKPCLSFDSHACDALLDTRPQVIGAAFEKDLYNCKIDGVIASGGLLKVGAQFLPPMPIVQVLVWLAQYYPKIIMPATNFESTFEITVRSSSAVTSPSRLTSNLFMRLCLSLRLR